jgi:hypothetical protein
VPEELSSNRELCEEVGRVMEVNRRRFGHPDA